MIQNPDYRGKWKPPLIDNPDFMVRLEPLVSPFPQNLIWVYSFVNNKSLHTNILYLKSLKFFDRRQVGASSGVKKFQRTLKDILSFDV